MNGLRANLIGVVLAAAVLAFAPGFASGFPIKAKDDRGKEIEFARAPRRIVSLAPTETELLFSLGLEKEIVGVTSFCTVPDAARSKEKVGGFADFDLEKISALKPDLILSFGTVQLPFVEALEKKGLKVFWIYPGTVRDILASFERVGEITGKAKEGRLQREAAERKLQALRTALGTVAGAKRPTIFRVMGIDPPATIGAESFQSDVFYLAGGINAFADIKKDFFEVDPAELLKRDPDVVIICGDDENTEQRRLQQSPVFSRLSAVKKGSIAVIPCDLTCKPGQHVAETVERIAEYLHRDTLSAEP